MQEGAELSKCHSNAQCLLLMRRHWWHYVQELDVQNAAAAEQHLKDMADYEVKLTEAAAAWEADKKKKKGKAKDEVSHHSVLLVQKGTVAMPHADCVAVPINSPLQCISWSSASYCRSTARE